VKVFALEGNERGITLMSSHLPMEKPKAGSERRIHRDPVAAGRVVMPTGCAILGLVATSTGGASKIDC